MSEGGNTLSERESKAVLSSYGVPFAEEGVATDAAEAARLAERLGRPVAVKLGGAGIAHKTERGLVRLGLSSPRDAENAARELLALSSCEPRNSSAVSEGRSRSTAARSRTSSLPCRGLRRSVPRSSLWT